MKRCKIETRESTSPPAPPSRLSFCLHSLPLSDSPILPTPYICLGPCSSPHLYPHLLLLHAALRARFPTVSPGLLSHPACHSVCQDFPDKLWIGPLDFMPAPWSRMAWAAEEGPLLAPSLDREVSQLQKEGGPSVCCFRQACRGRQAPAEANILSGLHGGLGGNGTN